MKINQRLVFPPNTRRDKTSSIINVILNQGEDIEWIWQYHSDGSREAIGYNIIKKYDKLQKNI